IDLNCVRAGLADDPMDYRYCGYGAAVGGCRVAREGLVEVYAEQGEMKLEWRSVARSYRKLLFGQGEQQTAETGQTVRCGIARDRVKQGLEGEGELSLGELVHCRVRYFSDGVALGTNEFIERVFRENRSWFGSKRKDGARKLAGGEYEGLRTLRDLRKQP